MVAFDPLTAMILPSGALVRTVDMGGSRNMFFMAVNPSSATEVNAPGLKGGFNFHAIRRRGRNRGVSSKSGYGLSLPPPRPGGGLTKP